VPGGGISPDGSRWIACRKDSFFLPYLLLSQRFRKKFLCQLRQAFRHGTLRFTGQLRSLASPATFEAMCEQAAKIEWVVHIKPPFGGPQRVLKYLARYTHRVAISNHRLHALENDCVSFEWQDYAHHSQRKIMTLDAIEFIRRFLLHVLPSGLVRIRQFGFLANRFRTHKLQLCRDLLAGVDVRTHRWAAPRQWLIPKDQVSFRTATQLDPLDSILFAAWIHDCGPDLERRRIPVDQNAVYRYRVAVQDDGTLYRPHTRHAFWAESRQLASQFKHVAVIDITDFYNQISHAAVLAQLDAALVPTVRKAALGTMLKHVAGTLDRGILVIRAMALGELGLGQWWRVIRP
jgi:hypothetical protein